MLDAISIDSIIYHSLWYEMPRVEQVYVELIMQRSQKPFEIKGLGVFVCSLETYLRVFYILHAIELEFVLLSTATKLMILFDMLTFQLVRNAISYYMVFRKLIGGI